MDKKLKSIGIKEIKGDSISLVKISIDDIKEIHELYSDETLCDLYGIQPHQNEKQTMRVINYWVEQIKSQSGIHLGIKQTGSDKIIGTIGFNDLKLGKFAEIGFGIQTKFRNKGFVKETIVKILEFGFNDLMLTRIEAQTDPNNFPCIRVLEKTGFRKEGHLRKQFFAHEKFHDTLIFSKLNSD
jgi:ribosomal-protein-alanine N-acetyltransferase